MKQILFISTLIIFLFANCRKKEVIKDYKIRYEISSIGTIANIKYTNSNGGIDSRWDFISSTSPMVIEINSTSKKSITLKATPEQASQNLQIKVFIDGSLKSEAQHYSPGSTSNNFDSWIEVSFVLD